MSKNALAILVTFGVAGLSHGQIDLYVNLAAGLFILPFFLFSAQAGQLAEKYQKSRLIRLIKRWKSPSWRWARSGCGCRTSRF